MEPHIESERDLNSQSARIYHLEDNSLNHLSPIPIVSA